MATAENPFPIVGVGASAGGIDALTRLVSALPPQPALALVVVLHLDPHHESQLTEILGSQSSLQVVDATHGIKVEPNRAYVIQPNTSVAIADGVLSVTPRPDDRRPHYPVDHYLITCARMQPGTGVCFSHWQVLLSGFVLQPRFYLAAGKRLFASNKLQRFEDRFESRSAPLGQHRCSAHGKSGFRLPPPFVLAGHRPPVIRVTGLFSSCALFF